ncbi:hypothetical protein AX17_000654 [Amanita inopinata Kibby_2008]|nr:hypothetical protein AX17_000654 [Amanita inopinata Kibby_2008]
MPGTQFKLSKRNGVMRRVTFPARPAWKALAARIGQLFDIPSDRVAVSYIDADNDEVTLNTEEELRQFYEISKPSEVMKFFVQDVTPSRSQSGTAIPEEKATYRNTFGQEVPLEDDWDIPNLEGVFIPESVLQRHAFVEELDSDLESDSKSMIEKPPIDIPATADGDKGKGKATVVDELDAASTISVIDEILSPIHVYDVSSQEDHDTPRLRSAATSVVAESTPKAPVSEVDKQQIEDNEKSATGRVTPHEVDDPPLPSMEPQASSSLPHDIGNLFSTLGNVISSHPELSEGFRNIIRNASNGTYWRAHRAALSQAAIEVSQASEAVAQEVLRNTEEEAGRRVMATLDTLFRSLSQVTRASRLRPSTADLPLSGDDGSTTVKDERESSAAAAASTVEKENAAAQGSPQYPPRTERATFTGRSTDWQSFLHPVYPQVVTPASHAAYLPQAPHSSFVYSRSPVSPFGLPPHPILPPYVPPPAANVPSAYPAPPHMAPPPPPPPPPFSQYSFGQISLQSPHDQSSREFNVTPSGKTANIQSDDLRAKVEAARAAYKAEKARYRFERKQSRRARDEVEPTGSGGIKPFEGLQSLVDVSETPVTQVVSNARGPFPQLEMISIPGPVLGTGQTQRYGTSHEGFGESLRSRAIKRICKQLGDMGFTESQHPKLAEKVSARLPMRRVLTKETEDGIVTSLLEELLPQSSSPVASGSGARGGN